MNKFVLGMIMSIFVSSIINASSSDEQLVLYSSGKFDHEKIKQFNIPSAVIKTVESCINSSKNCGSDLCGITFNDVRVLFSKTRWDHNTKHIITMHDCLSAGDKSYKFRKILDDARVLFRKIRGHNNQYMITMCDPSNGDKSYKVREILVTHDGKIVYDAWQQYIVENSEICTEKKIKGNCKPQLNYVYASCYTQAENGSTLNSMGIEPVYKDCGIFDYNSVVIKNSDFPGGVIVYQCPIGCYYQDLDGKDHTELHEWLQNKINSRQETILSRIYSLMPNGKAKWYNAVVRHKKIKE